MNVFSRHVFLHLLLLLLPTTAFIVFTHFAPLEDLWMQETQQVKDDTVRLWALTNTHDNDELTSMGMTTQLFEQHMILLEQKNLENPEIQITMDVNCPSWSTPTSFCLCYEDLLGDDVTHRYNVSGKKKSDAYSCGPGYSGVCSGRFGDSYIGFNSPVPTAVAFETEHGTFDATFTFNFSFATPKKPKSDFKLIMNRRTRILPYPLREEYSAETTMLRGHEQVSPSGSVQRRFFKVLPLTTRAFGFDTEGPKFPWCNTYWHFKNARLASPDRDLHDAPTPNAVEGAFIPYSRTEFVKFLKKEQEESERNENASAASLHFSIGTWLAATVAVSHFLTPQ